MKWIPSLIAAVAAVTAAATAAPAIDFNIKGQWNMGFGVADTTFVKRTRDANGSRKANNSDRFAARQRVLIQLDAVASESLSGSLMFHIGPQQWGRAGQGGALGADGRMIKVRQAYIDWAIPDTTVKTRMGIQNFALPYAAGGSAVFDLRAAAVNTHVDFNENVGLNVLWFRPLNDNYDPATGIAHGSDRANYLDNMDLFALMLPMNFEDVSVTPWIMYGILGRNAVNGADFRNTDYMDGRPATTMTPFLETLNNRGGGLNVTRSNYGLSSRTYANMFWAGLPVKVKTFDPWNIEFDVNYGYVQSLGGFSVAKRNNPADTVTGSSKRQGWLAKALVEYKLDWGVPGIFAWYGSGDDGNPRNGSERMPSVCPYVFTTSMMGDGNLAWGPAGDYLDNNDSLAGTWGIGFQLRDMSFLENLSTTFRVAWWGGTNSPSMVKYMDSAHAWYSTAHDNHFEGPYMTTNDGLLEFNLVNVYKMYENFNINFELGYVCNFMDDDTWKRSYNNWGSYTKQDIWKAQLIFTYQF